MPEHSDTLDLYLELLKRSLTHSLYSGPDAIGYPSRTWLRRKALALLEQRGIVPVRILPSAGSRRREGRDWPLFAQTMVGHHRLDNLRHCIESVLEDDVPGDFIECGVWRGGASIYMRGVLKAHGVRDRGIWLADSFRGLPAADADTYPADEGATWHIASQLAVAREEVAQNFRRYGLLDDQVRFVEGWFKDTLPRLDGRNWALVRLDGDMYESTMQGLENLYPNLVPGGYLIIDDYEIENCRRAVDDFRSREGITTPIQEIDWTGVYWRRDSCGDEPRASSSSDDA